MTAHDLTRMFVHSVVYREVIGPVLRYGEMTIGRPAMMILGVVIVGLVLTRGRR